MDLPQYACAILEDAEGRLLLESRPDDALHAAGRLTCFGGRREAGETPEECLRRELREELAWVPQHLEKRVALKVGGTLMAWFYHARLDRDVAALRLVPGFRALLVKPAELPNLPVSAWHRAVLNAWLSGEIEVVLDA